MHLFDLFVRHPVKVAVGVLLLVLFGLVSLFKLPKQLTPEVITPTVTVSTSWPGANPQEIEREIIQPQEDQLRNVEGVIKMSSECSRSNGRISLQFPVGTDLQEALLKVNSRVQQISSYPPNARKPVIYTRELTDRPIAYIALMVKPPTTAELTQFQQEHPHLSQLIEPAKIARNPGLRGFRLRNLESQLEDHPQLGQLIPPNPDLRKRSRFAEEVIETRLERVPGVIDVDISGELREEVQVVVNPQRLSAHHVTIQQVRTLLQAENKNTSGGTFSEGNRRESVRTLGQFHSVEDIEKLVLENHEGEHVLLKDVADVRIDFRKAEHLSRRYGTTSVTFRVQKADGTNVLNVMDALKKAISELNEGILRDEGLVLYQYYDETEYIHSAIGLVQQNIFLGGSLTMIILFLFLSPTAHTLLTIPLIAVTAVSAAYLSPWYFLLTIALIVVVGLKAGRSALIVGLAIPVSIVGTFLFLKFFGRTLNVISLAGLAFAVGMLVDNAVVIMENIHRHWQMGKSPRTAAVDGASQVAGAVLASTLTTVAVFLPVIFVEEVAGQLFRDIAIAVSSAVGLSLCVSYTLIPALAARMYRENNTNSLSKEHCVTTFEEKTHSPISRNETAIPSNSLPSTSLGSSHQETNGSQAGHQAPIRSSTETESVSSRSAKSTRLLSWLDALGEKFVSMILNLNRFLLQSTVRSCLTVSIMLLLAFSLTWMFWPSVDYLPTGSKNYLFASLYPPPGYNLEKLDEMGCEVEDFLQPHWDLDPDDPEVETAEYPPISYYFFLVRGSGVLMGVRAHDGSRILELKPLLKKLGRQFPGTSVSVRQVSIFDRSRSGGRSISLEVRGPQLERLIELGKQIQDQIPLILPDAQVSANPSLDLANPEVHVTPRSIAASEQQMDTAELGYAVDALIDGAYAGDFYLEGSRIDITILGEEAAQFHSQDLKLLPIATAERDVTTLGALAHIQLRSGPQEIARRERQRAITLQIDVPDEMPLQSAIETLSREVVHPLTTQGELKGGYSIALSGTADKLEATWLSLKWNLLLSLAITYLLMAALFESWLYPLVIILSVPLGAVGGILGLRLLNLFVHQPLDMLTMLGFVILIGTVVNNAILIVHQSLQFLRAGSHSIEEALLESVRTRIRPVMMTTLTTVLGLLPLVLFPGAGSELYRGVGSVVLGGLVVSTLFTLILIPIFFSLTMKGTSRMAQLGREGHRIKTAEEPPVPTYSPEEPQYPEPAETKEAPVISTGERIQS